jgi:clathrin heavy chain
MQSLPLRYEEKLKLPSLGLASDLYKQQTLSMESEKCICIKETGPDGSTMFDLVNITGTPSVQKKPIKAEAAIMHPNNTLISLRNGQNIQVKLKTTLRY